MGLAKNDLITCQERGYGHSDNNICRDCIGNKSLKNYIKIHGNMSTCDYCGKHRKVVTIEELMEPIMSGIAFKYDKAVNALSFIDGEYNEPTFSTYELIHYELANELMIENEKILDDIYNIMDDDLWCETNPYCDKEYETEFYSWQSFCRIVKYKSRYVFFRRENIVSEYDYSNPINILDLIGEHIEKLRLIKRLEKGKKVFRGRMHEKDTVLNDSIDFGPPPIELAKSNRMSPEGISMFYAALDEKTVLSEIYSNSYECATVASFRIKYPLTLINLSRLKELDIPSIFDEDERQKQSAIIFLKMFSDEISKAIDSYQGIEYVPTQIVTEYFRYIFKSEKYDKIDGIIYDSSQLSGGKCIVLFMDRDEFKNDETCMLNKNSMKINRFEKRFESLPIKKGE